MPAVKEKKQYRCSACGAMQLRWAGKCPECGEWNTLEEVTVREPEKSRSSVAPVNTMSQPVRQAKLLDRALEAMGFFRRVEVFAVDVLDERHGGRRLVGHVAHQHRNLGQARQARGCLLYTSRCV